ncbi:MAG: hypothetical protein NZ933_02800 [Bacteroidia bacterium]|nr:hypothetical protein [Bacteroidia bacterium]
MRKASLARWLLWVAWMGGCASIHPPDGGDADTKPPSLKKVKLRFTNRGKAILKFRWDEYLAPMSQLYGTGIWINPPCSFRATLRGKYIRIKVDSLVPEGNWVVWGGPGIRDFTVGNAFPPTPLCYRGYLDTSSIFYPLYPPPDKSSTVWVEFYNDSSSYFFMAWEGRIQATFLPRGIYHAWAWEDKDGDKKWNEAERIWLPESLLAFFPEPFAPIRDSTRKDTQEIEPQLKPSPWRQWKLDTFPPAPPRYALRDSEWAVASFKEPISLLHIRGEGRLLSSKALLLRVGSCLHVADSAGNSSYDTLLAGRDTQRYSPQVFWPGEANLVTPYIYLTTSEKWDRRDSFWVCRVGDSLYAGEAIFENEEICLAPLSIQKEIELPLIFPRGDTIRVRISTQKFQVRLPNDSLGRVSRWRLYGVSLRTEGGVEVKPNQEIWLPPGSYSLIGLSDEGPFWQPLQIKQGRPLLSQPIIQERVLIVPEPKRE